MSAFAFPTLQGRTSETFTPPPIGVHGLELSISQTWDFHLTHSPNHTLFVYDDDDGKPQRIQWQQAVRAFHRAGRLVQALVEGKPAGTDRPVIGILASSDAFSYFALNAGIIRAGYTVFPISTRNSPDAVAHLLMKASCSHLFVSHDTAMTHLSQSALAKLGNEHDIDVHPMPHFEELYVGNEDVKLFPPITEVDWNATALILHSSGTTSYPKPIHLSHRFMLEWGAQIYYGEQDLCGQVLSCHSIPMFHAMGAIQMSWATTSGFAMSSFKPSLNPTIPTSDSVLTSALRCGCSMILSVPTFIENWARDESLLSTLQRFRAIAYGGAPLQQQTGDYLVSNGVQIFSVFGTTEIGGASMVFPNKSEVDSWSYFKFSGHVNAILVPRDEHGEKYELVFPLCSTHTPAVLNTEVDGQKAYATNDLVIRHPTIPDRWKIFGRADDQIIHSTGEKTNPGPLEAILQQDPHIKGAVIFGRGRFQPGVLLDLQPEYKFDTKDAQKLSELRNAVWETVEKANAFAPQHSRLFKEMILFSDDSIPFEYTAKGTPRRHAIIAQYDKIIDAAYNAVDESSQSDVAPPLSWTPPDSTNFVRTIVTRVMEQQISDDDDMFQNGCDSLQATWIRNAILHALRQTSRIDTHAIPSTFVYSHPSITALARYIAHIAASGSSNSEEAQHEAKIKEMEDTVTEFTSSFPIHSPVHASMPAYETILLTGSTGGFGAHVLGELIALPTVGRVYALNRPSSSSISLRERHAAAFKSRGIDASVLNSEKLILLEADMSASRFGLDNDIYETMRTSVTTIMHIAWTVNFNNALSSFRPNIKGVRNLVDFALSSPLPSPPPILFTSSIAVFQNWPVDKPAPEAAIIDASIPLGGGYGESKWVSERILQIAGEQTTLRPIVVRVGQLAGGEHGAWNTREWFPSIVKSATVVKCLPDCRNLISWIPADTAARAFIEMRSSSAVFLHLLHPHAVPWSAVAQPIAAHLGVPLVSYSEWLEKLEQDLKSGSAMGAVVANPALRLIEFYRASGGHTDDPTREAMNLAFLETTQAELASSVLGDKHLPRLGEKDVNAWLRYWQDEGYITMPLKA